MNELKSSHEHLSRRQWLGRVSVPAASVVDASLIGIKATATPAN